MFHICCQDMEAVPGNQMLYLESNSKERLAQKQVVTGVSLIFCYMTEVLVDASVGFHDVWG